MATDTTEPRTENIAGLATLVGDILTDAQELTRQQIELVKVEVRDTADKAQGIGVLFVAGLGLATVAGVLFAFAAAQFLVWAIPSLPDWGAYAIVGLLPAGAAAMLFGVCKQKMDSFSLLPEKAVEALQENLEWKTEQK